MGKWGKYLKHYKKEWEKLPMFKDWLEPSTEKDVLEGKGEAHCKPCQVNLRAHKGDLEKHHTTCQRHKQKLAAYNRQKQPSLETFGVQVASDKEKGTDTKLAVFIAMHCPVKTIDHLGEILKEMGRGSTLERLRMHRTKCSKVISYVIAPEFLKELLEDIGDSPYSLICDEATDNSSAKFMGVCVRYYSKAKKEMITDFLGLIEVTSCTGEALAVAVKDFLAKIGLPIQNMTSIGTDGAPNMCGHVNSFYTHLKKDVPGLQLFKCVCHSLDKCTEYAHKVIPDDVNFLLRESHNYFAHSAKRIAEYQDMYKASNNGKAPLSIPKACDTRWLFWLPICKVVFNQWTELGAYFNMKKSANDQTATKLAKLFKDSSMYLYLAFLQNVMKDVSKVNMAFQKTNADVTKLHVELRSLLFGMAGRILKDDAIPHADREGVLRGNECDVLRNNLRVTANQKSLDTADFGDSFKKALPCCNIDPQTLHNVRQNCGQYIFTLCNELIGRMPGNIKAVENLRNLAPHLAYTRASRPSFQQLPLNIAGADVDMDELESQWSNLVNVPLRDLCPLIAGSDKLSITDTVAFWGYVMDYRDASGDHPFRLLAEFALKALTIPVSNAVVERLFSFMAAVKTKQRNRMQLLMLESILRIRVHLKVQNKCCTQFNTTPRMLTRFTAAVYDTPRAKENDAAGEGVPEAEGQPPVDDDVLFELDEDDHLALTLYALDGTSCVVPALPY